MSSSAGRVGRIDHGTKRREAAASTPAQLVRGPWRRLALLVVEAIARELLRNETGHVALVEGEHEILIRIVDRRAVLVQDRGEEVVVVRDEQRVLRYAVEDHVLSKRHPFDLGRDVDRTDSGGGEGGNEVEKQRLRDRERRERRRARKPAHVSRASQIDLENL